MSKSEIGTRLNQAVMALERQIAEFERKQQELQVKLEKLLAVREAIEDLSADLVSIVEGRESASIFSDQEEKEGQTQGTHFDRIAEYIRGKKNLPQTIAAIETGTGIPRSSVSAVLYRTHTSSFESVDLPDTGKSQRAKAWRLTQNTGRSSFDDEAPIQATNFPDPRASGDRGPQEDEIPF